MEGEARFETCPDGRKSLDKTNDSVIFISNGKKLYGFQMKLRTEKE
jgi:hypothetical protein